MLTIITLLLFILVLLVAFRPHPSGERVKHGPRKFDFVVVGAALAVLTLTVVIANAMGG